MANINRCYSIEDLNKKARKALPGVVYDYIAGGAEDEITVKRNRDSFSAYEFAPRVLRDVRQIDLSATMLGKAYSMPLFCAPTGMSRLFHYQGEKAVARAAYQANIPYSLSTVSTCSIEEIAALSHGSNFFQIYVWHNRDLVSEFINRCKTCRYDGIILAVDVAVFGNRERDLRNGHGRPLELQIKTALSGLTKLKWFFRFLTSGKLKMANMVDHLPYGGDAQKAIDTVNEQFDASVTWDDAKKLRDKWEGNFILKGIQCVDDAVKAADMGATGIVLSNHGGRQLDFAPPALDILPEVVNAVKGKIEIFIDGGIRRGSDVIKAMALGANGCMIGRPYLYGLAAAGEEGVKKALDILKTEMERVMRLIGCDAIKKLDSSYIKKISSL
ncbi:MAG: alpha-hydroxy-acid oxidizing protein [Proteobacteria bacterium]|nr:alpha-hydroxy-acid oxidizing protein [Pseudomonadota bacterium]